MDENITEFDDVGEFARALELAIIESKLKPLKCVLCQEDTLERVVAFGPGKPARPILLGVCEVCAMLPGWEKEVDNVMSAYLAMGGQVMRESEFYDDTDKPYEEPPNDGDILY